MIFTKNYNVILKLMSEVCPEFKTNYANFIQSIPDNIKNLCKKGQSFCNDKYEMYDDQSYVRLTVNEDNENYSAIIVTATMPHTIAWLDKGERMLICELDTNNNNFQCLIEKVAPNKFMVIVNREHNENNYMSVCDYTYDQLSAKLDTANRATSIKQIKK